MVVVQPFHAFPSLNKYFMINAKLYSFINHDLLLRFFVTGLSPH
jgi:hypothetical protein